MIIAAEMDAIRGAVRELKMWGISYEPCELTPAGLEQSIKFWKKYYFGAK